MIVISDERWEPITGFVGQYEISNKGRVRNSRNGYILKNFSLPSGYLFVRFWKDGKKRVKYIHRLVADAFCDRPEGCDIVNHLDFNVQNNTADNLEWVTPRGNILYSMQRNRYKKFPSAKCIVGEKDNVKHLFQSAHEAEELTGVSRRVIYKLRKTGKRSRGWTFRNA